MLGLSDVLPESDGEMLGLYEALADGDGLALAEMLGEMEGE
jgi:hypothetical protein